MQRAQLCQYAEALFRIECGEIVTVECDHVMKDFSEARCHRPHFGTFDAGGEFHGGQPFSDQLASEVDLRSVLENDGDLRESEF